MGNGNQEPVKILIEVLQQTDQATLISDGAVEVWVPHSLIDFDSEIDGGSAVGVKGQMIVPQWFAEQEGLV